MEVLDILIVEDLRDNLHYELLNLLFKGDLLDGFEDVENWSAKGMRLVSSCVLTAFSTDPS